MIRLLSFLVIIFYVQYCSYVSQNQKISSHSKQDMIHFVSSHQKKIWFCLISQNKNSVLSYFMKNESDSVSFYWKKISSHSDSDSEQNWIRIRNPGSCSQSIHIKIVMNLIKICDLKVLHDLMTNLIKNVFVRLNKLDVVNVENQINLFFEVHSQADVSLIESKI